jgi:hypothetical protein
MLQNKMSMLPIENVGEQPLVGYADRLIFFDVWDQLSGQEETELSWLASDKP